MASLGQILFRALRAKRKKKRNNRIERGLTLGEIALAKKMFGNSINYSLVSIHNYKYVFFQPSNSGMTPNGELYIHGAYMADYSSAVPSLKAFFIHEMTHVYQYQLKILNPIAAAFGEIFEHMFNYSDAYKYTLTEKSDLLDYDIEQQASMVEDYYRITYAKLGPTSNLQNNYTDVVKNSLYQKVLKKFIANPEYARHHTECQSVSIGKAKIRRCKRVLIK